LQGLLTAINSDPHFYQYYGSETLPPCREEVNWFVFARPRSISKFQFEFLKYQLSKNKNKNIPIKRARTFLELYGNKRKIQAYNQNIRGKINSNKQGIKQVKRMVNFKNTPKD